jgi:hypothetical protein
VRRGKGKGDGDRRVNMIDVHFIYIQNSIMKHTKPVFKKEGWRRDKEE